jgi:N-acetyl-beta-hexosaminidase
MMWSWPRILTCISIITRARIPRKNRKRTEVTPRWHTCMVTNPYLQCSLLTSGSLSKACRRTIGRNISPLSRNYNTWLYRAGQLFAKFSGANRRKKITLIF